MPYKSTCLTKTPTFPRSSFPPISAASAGSLELIVSAPSTQVLSACRTLSLAGNDGNGKSNHEDEGNKHNQSWWFYQFHSNKHLTTWVSQRHSPNSTCTQNRIRDVACVGTTPSFSATCQSTLEAINTSQRLLATQAFHSSLHTETTFAAKTWNFESCSWTVMRKLLLKWMSETLPCWKNNHNPSDAVTQRM